MKGTEVAFATVLRVDTHTGSYEIYIIGARSLGRRYYVLLRPSGEAPNTKMELKKVAD